MENIYDTDRIIAEAIRTGYDIAPDRMEWVKLCHALKILGNDESSFVALSRIHGTPDQVSRRKWREEKRLNTNIRTEAEARALIVSLAKAAGVDVRQFLLSQKSWNDRPTWRTNRQATATKITTATATPAALTYLIPMADIAKTENHAEQTALFKWMAGEFGNYETQRVFRLYHVGGSNFWRSEFGLSCSFPMISREGIIANAQLSPFNSTNGKGLRNPSGDKIINWVIARLNKQRRAARLPEYAKAEWSFFGEHLLNDPDQVAKPIAIVEAPKSALIGSIVYPEYLWFACWSCGYLCNCISIEPLRGRRVVIFPDRDHLTEWHDKAKAMAAAGLAVSIDTTIKRNCPEYLTDNNGNTIMENGKPKKCTTDIADLILLFRHGEQAATEPPPNTSESATLTPDMAEAQRVFEDMKRRYPHLAEVAEILELEAKCINL